MGLHKFFVLFSVMMALVGAAPLRLEYAEGQVWEYQTRASDAGSLIKIQQIETLPDEKGKKIYHISMIGLHFRHKEVAGIIVHMPVSRETLDASVTRLSSSAASFPDSTDGIKAWRDAKGGVFTISLAEIAEIADRSTSSNE